MIYLDLLLQSLGGGHDEEDEEEGLKINLTTKPSEPRPSSLFGKFLHYIFSFRFVLLIGKGVCV